MLAVSFSCTPLAFARTGVTGNMDADMVYYWSSSQSHSSHQVHLLDSDWTYCVDPYNGYTAGLTYTSEDPVKSGKLSQECVTDMALAYKYVWEEDLYTTPAGAKLKNDYERYAAAQVLIWTILVDYYPSLGPHHNRITVKGVDITGDGNEDSNNKAVYRWIAAHRDDYVGHCLYFDAGRHQSFAMNFEAEALTGTVQLNKASANATLTKGNDSYSLAGAHYGIYSDKACTKSVATLVTDETGAASASDIPIGTYYVKETKAPQGYLLNDDVHEVVVTRGQTSLVNGSKGVTDTPKTGGIALSKTSSNTVVTGGNDNYSLAGAIYAVFSDEACKSKATELVTDANGKASVDNMALGTYYVKETTAPKGYDVDKNVYEVVVKADKTTPVNGSKGVSDKPKTGSIGLVKASANQQITESNACYSLKDAKYGIFKDASCTNKLADMTTDAQGKSQIDGIPLGTYYVKELSAPAGYALDTAIRPVKVAAGETSYVGSDGKVEDAPQAGTVELAAIKADAQTANGQAQGSASLEGAQFAVSYYDGYYDEGSLPEKPTRAWVLATDARGHALMDEKSRVSGPDFYRDASGNIVIPLGTVLVRETGAPKGYRLGNGSDGESLSKLCQITSTGTAATSVTPFEPITVVDQVQRGGVMVGKVDRQNGAYAAQGSATLEGATFQIVSENDQRVVVDDVEYVKGSVVKTIATELQDGRFVASTPLDCLPVGTYTISEASTCEGYLFDEQSRGWRKQFTIEEDGQAIDITQPEDAASNLVIRGDFEFSKVDGLSAERLSNVAFMVTSQTTGEAHVIVTDENGMASTAASWNSHEASTNANDAAVTEEGGQLSVDDEALDPRAGLWFSGSVEHECAPDDELGALPFDTYEVNELRSAGNEGLELVTFTTTVSRNGRELDLGTIDDNPGPSIGTSLADGNGVKLAASTGSCALTDTVTYANLKPKEHYRLLGELHALDDQGNDAGIASTTEAEFEPKSSAGTIDVIFEFDVSQESACRFVATERLLDAQGNTVCSHEDLGDEGQTVRVPSILTSLHAQDDRPSMPSTGTVELVDAVAYSNLVPGRTYAMQATLHVRGEDGSDEGVATDKSGEQITARQSFTPAQPDGTVDVTFRFEPSDAAGQTYVAFEELTYKDVTYATHADISDDAQSISAAHIRTTMTGQSGAKEVVGTEAVQLVDEVYYCNLVAGERYTLLGTLHVIQDGADLGELKDEAGNPVSAKTLFAPDGPNGTASVPFTVDARKIGDCQLVAFEVLLDEDGKVVASHEDAHDEGQTVVVTKTPEPEKPEEPSEQAAPPTPDKPSAPAPETPPTNVTIVNEKPKTPVTTRTSTTTRKTPAKARTAAKTGDELGMAAKLIAPAALLGLAISTIAIRQMRRCAPVTIQRGPARQQGQRANAQRRPQLQQATNQKARRNPTVEPRGAIRRPSVRGRRGAHRR